MSQKPSFLCLLIGSTLFGPSCADAQGTRKAKRGFRYNRTENSGLVIGGC